MAELSSYAQTDETEDCSEAGYIGEPCIAGWKDIGPLIARFCDCEEPPKGPVDIFEER